MSALAAPPARGPNPVRPLRHGAVALLDAHALIVCRAILRDPARPPEARQAAARHLRDKGGQADRAEAARYLGQRP